MNENLIKRIGDEYLQANHKDGETFLHTDYNEFLSIFKTSINENYYDIQRIIKGTLKVYNTTKLDGATLSRSVNGSLSSDDNTIPSSKQVKTYVDIYYNELSKKDESLSTTVSGAVSASNTAIDTANSAAFDASNALDIATQASTQASRADFNADTAMNITTELSRTKADVTEMEKRALITETGNKLLFSVDPSTYVLTIKLLDKLNNVLSTGTVDLPIESLVMNVSYDAETKSITLTLQNGEKVSFSVSTLVEGLVSEDTFNQRIEQLKKDLRTELTQTITDDANSSFNQNVKNKTDSFNENSSLKTNEFNNNAAQKTLDYNNNCISKTNSFNQNSTQKLTEFNDNYTSKLNSFNSNADLRMDEYNANADNKIAEYDEHSQELNNKIIDTRNELERVKNDVLETGTDTDTYIHLEDSAMAEYQELSVDGVCVQETTTGYNLFDKDSVVFSKNFDENGNIVNRTSTDFYSPIYIKVKPNTNYIFTTVKDGNSIIDWSRFMQYDENKNFIIGTIQATKKMKTLTNTEYVRLGGVYNSHLYMQLIEGNIEKPYEPYTGGQSSPSPDYPQEIKTIENSLKITSCNKNLLNYDDFIYNSYIDGTTGELVHSTTMKSTDFINASNMVGKTYTMSGNQYCFLAEYDENKTFIKRHSSGEKTSITLTIGSTTKYIRMSVFGVTDNLLPNWKLELGTQATSFEQHLETQITANLPEGEFIGKINDTYKDTLKVEYNEEDGQYHLNLYKNIGKYVFDGSEVIERTRTDFTLSKVFQINNLPSKFNYDGRSINKNSISNSFIYKNGLYNNDISDYSVEKVESSKLRFRVPFDYCEDINEFKTKMQNINLVVYMKLATPYTLDLGIVDMPITYNEVTNLFTDSDLMPQINAKYYRNFITTIQNLQVNEKALKQELVDINTRLSALENATTNVASESEVV